MHINKSLLLVLAILGFLTQPSSGQTPPPPTVNPSSGISAGTYTISWSPVAGSGEFEIFEFNQDPATFGSGPWPAGSWTQFKSGNKTSVSRTKTQSGTWYYRVRTWSKNSSGIWVHSSLSTPAVAQTVEYIPSPAINPTTPTGTGTFTLTWNTVPGAGSYEVFEFIDDPQSWGAGTYKQYKVYTNSLKVTKTTSGNWYYRVRTWKKNSVGTWQYSGLSLPAVQQVVDLIPPPVVHEPDQASLSGTYTISWDPVAGAQDYEIFEFSEDPGTWTGAWPAGKWTQFKSNGQTSVTRTKAENGTWYYRVRVWKQAADGTWIYSSLSSPAVAQEVDIIQGAVNLSAPATSAEVDNVNIPIFKAGTTAFRLTATYPNYESELDNKFEDFSGQPEGPVIWWLGQEDDSSAEFRQSGFASTDDYYPMESAGPIGTVEPVNQCPKGLGAGGVQELRFNFTAQPGYELNNLWRFTIRPSEISGKLDVRIFYYVRSTSDPHLHRIDISPGIQVVPGMKKISWVFGPDGGSTQYRKPGTDEIQFGIRVASSDPGSYVNFDYARLEVAPRLPRAVWSIGTTHDQPSKFKTSGFSDGDVYYVQDFPATGEEETSTECPAELNGTTISNQYIRFTTVDAEQFFGGSLRVEMKSVTGILAVRAKLWTGTEWTDLGRQTFTSSARTKEWSIADYSFLEGVDANQIWLDVETQAEGGPSSSDARGVYNQIVFSGRAPAADQEFTLYAKDGVTVRGKTLGGWWRGPTTGMMVNVNGGLSRANVHLIQIHKNIPNETPNPEVFAFYQDGGARIIPFQRGDGDNDWIPYGSTVMFGPAVVADRPYVDVESLTINPADLSLVIGYRNGTSARATINPSADRTRNEVDITNISYDVNDGPIAILRSMWVRDGNSDVDTIETQAGEEPILGSWELLDGQWWMFKRKTPSVHNTWAPDIRLDVTGSQ